MGPPPRTKESAVIEGVQNVAPASVFPGGAGGDHASMVAAISQQSAALTSLVAHLASGDAISDLQAGSSSTSVSTKGVVKRERMQQELASRKSQFFLQVQQQIFKKMYPARVCPQTEEELLKTQVSMATYLEKYGAFKGNREMGYMMWMLSHAMDAASQGDFYATKEFLALMAGRHGAISAGWTLADCLHCGAPGGTTGSAVCGEVAEHDIDWTSLCPSCAPQLGGGEPELRQGDRSTDHPKRRGQKQGSGQGGRRPRCLPQTSASFSKASKARGRPQSCVIDEFGGGGEAQSVSPPMLHDASCSSEKADGVELNRLCPSKKTFKNRSQPSPRCSTTNADPSSGHKNSKGKSSLSSARPEKASEAVPEVSLLSLPKWCAQLTSQVLRSRSAFSAYLSGSIQLSRGSPSRGTSAPTFFPIPCPVLGCFDRMPGKVSSGRRHAVNVSKVVHIVCMALNFWHAGGRSSPDEMLLRGPNRQHRCLYDRIRSLLKSDGLASCFSISGAGRRFPELSARLAGISSLLTSQGVSSDPYDKSFHGSELNKDSSVAPELSPYRDLDPSRLVLFGSGKWDPSPFLDEELLMAFREPKSILVDIPVGPRPNIRDSPSCVASLAHKWDSLGLLRLHDRPMVEEDLVRIFNVPKNSEQDRQIGDRRGRNSQEAKVRGPSSLLPSGVDISDVCVDPKRHSVFVSITDRKDYYHQLAITPSKAFCNTVGPPVRQDDVSGTLAFALWSASAKSRRYVREVHGDRLGSGGNVVRHHVSEAPLPQNHLWVCFNSVLQGDRTGVEVATAAHAALLRSYGLLDDERRLIANRPLGSSRECQGLVIDDFLLCL